MALGRGGGRRASLSPRNSYCCLSWCAQHKVGFSAHWWKGCHGGVCNVGPWGAYHSQPGLQRYRCIEKEGQRTFNDLTGTLLDGSKRSVMHWMLATFLVCLSCSSRRIAREVGVHVRTGYRWCWWLRNAALSYEMERQLA